MVDFRYHLVSIIAVFLALALGIIVGTTALNGQLLDNLKGSIDTLTGEKRSLEGTIGELRSQVAGGEALAAQLGPTAVAGQLTGRRVVLVTAPNAGGGVASDLVPLLQAAGAIVTGRVQLRPDLLDPAEAGSLTTLLQQVAPGRSASSDTAPVQQAATEIAQALLAPSEGVATGSQTAATTLLQAFAKADFLDLDPEGDADTLVRADLSVVIAGDPVVSSDPAVPTARARALLSIGAALDAAGDGTVVVGPLAATAEGGAVRALRDDGALSERVSSVDGADLASGRLSTVFALEEQAAGGSGRYGTGPGSQGPLPSLPVR